MRSNSLLRFAPSNRSLVPYAVLLAGLIFTAVICYSLSKIGQGEDEERFKASEQNFKSAIESRIETYEALLRATSGFFASSDLVTKQEFAEFITRLGIEEHYPGIQGIAFISTFDSNEKDAFIQKMRQLGRTDFRIWPEGNAEPHYVVVYLEPANSLNLLPIGYDIGTEPVRLAALQQARDSGQITATRAVKLVQEIDPRTKQQGFVVYFPIYKRGSDVSTVESRRDALIGLVSIPFRADDFFKSVLANRKTDIDLKIVDAPKDQSGQLLHDSSRFNNPLPAEYRPRFTASDTLKVGGQNWQLNFASRPEFDMASGETFVPHALIGGLFITLLFFSLLHSQMKARSEAEKAAANLRESEATIRQTLADRERAEQALRESEESYRELFENANDIVCTLDLNYTVTSVNKAGEIFTGYSREELLKMDLSTLMTPASAETSRRMLQRKLHGEARTNYEVDLLSKSGELVAVEISSRLLVKDGKPVGIHAIARDITARRRVEEALREADQRALSEYERLLERIATLSQALGTAHDLTAIFRALRDFTVVSAPCDGLFVSLYDALREVRTACYAWGDGNEFDVSGLPPMPITDVGPNSRAMRTGDVVITNNYMVATRGRPSVILGPDNGLRPQSSLVVPMAVMGRIVGTIEVQSYQNGAYREAHVTAMRMAANLTAVAIENVRLLERESRARAAAEDSNRLKDEFLATVSHELRTPLTAILGWSRMLESGDLSSQTTERAIETIRRNAKAQAQIVDDILDVSRIITGNLYLDLHPVEVSPVIESAVNVVRPTAEAKSIEIQVHYEPRPLMVSGDSNRLQQVFWNLLSNAIKFTPSGGTVRVDLTQRDSAVVITVSDTGTGIDPEFLPFVFDRFRQADSTTTRRHGGLGLGLAIARHLVEIHGGNISAESCGKDQGSRFTVSLPLIAPVPAIPELGEAPETRILPEAARFLSGLHILVVDDDEDTLELIQAALGKYHARVTAVTSAGEALATLELAEPDVLISDIGMPGTDGYELIKQIRSFGLSTSRTLPAVAITAYAKDEDRDRALASGYQRYLAKPIELEELITAVADALKGEAIAGT